MMRSDTERDFGTLEEAKKWADEQPDPAKDIYLMPSGQYRASVNFFMSLAGSVTRTNMDGGKNVAYKIHKSGWCEYET